MDDSVALGAEIEPGDTITLPDGRVALVVGIPDAIYGAPEPPPPTPPEHRDIWCFGPDGLVLSATTYDVDAELPDNDDNHRFVFSAPHTWSCEEYKPE